MAAKEGILASNSNIMMPLPVFKMACKPTSGDARCVLLSASFIYFLMRACVGPSAQHTMNVCFFFFGLKSQCDDWFSGTVAGHRALARLHGPHRRHPLRGPVRGQQTAGLSLVLHMCSSLKWPLRHSVGSGCHGKGRPIVNGGSAGPAESRQSTTRDRPIDQVVGTAHPNVEVRNLRVVLE